MKGKHKHHKYHIVKWSYGNKVYTDKIRNMYKKDGVFYGTRVTNSGLDFSGRGRKWSELERYVVSCVPCRREGRRLIPLSKHAINETS